MYEESFQVRDGRWWKKIQECQTLKLGDAHVHPQSLPNNKGRWVSPSVLTILQKHPSYFDESTRDPVFSEQKKRFAVVVSYWTSLSIAWACCTFTWAFDRPADGLYILWQKLMRPWGIEFGTSGCPPVQQIPSSPIVLAQLVLQDRSTY